MTLRLIGKRRLAGAMAISALALLAAAAAGYWIGHRPASEGAVRSPAAARSVDQVQLASFARQLDDLRKRVDGGSPRADSPAKGFSVVRAASPRDAIDDVQATRAQEEERRRAYMADVAQAFEAEKIDPAWSASAATRVTATFSADAAVRDIARDVHCRQQTCRIQIADEGRKVSTSMPAIALRLADLFPSVSADYVDRGDGTSTMVIYMSTESSVTAMPVK